MSRERLGSGSGSIPSAPAGPPTSLDAMAAGRPSAGCGEDPTACEEPTGEDEDAGGPGSHHASGLDG